MSLRVIPLNLASDERGQTTIEWVLIVAGFGLPMIYVFRMLLSILAAAYQMVTFMETLPFP